MLPKKSGESTFHKLGTNYGSNLCKSQLWFFSKLRVSERRCFTFRKWYSSTSGGQAVILHEL